MIAHPVWRPMGTRHAPDRTALGDSPAVHRVFDNVRNEGEHDVIVHGDRFGKPTSDGGHEIDPQHIVDAIRNNPDYVEGTPIRLLSCHSGNDIGWAQHIANELGVPVRAPSDLVGVRAVPDSPATLPNDTEWRICHPVDAEGNTPKPTVERSINQPSGHLPKYEEDPLENWDIMSGGGFGDETDIPADPAIDDRPPTESAEPNPTAPVDSDAPNPRMPEEDSEFLRPAAPEDPAAQSPNEPGPAKLRDPRAAYEPSLAQGPEQSGPEEQPVPQHPRLDETRPQDDNRQHRPDEEETENAAVGAPEPAVHKPTEHSDEQLPKHYEDPHENWDIHGDDEAENEVHSSTGGSAHPPVADATENRTAQEDLPATRPGADGTDPAEPWAHSELELVSNKGVVSVTEMDPGNHLNTTFLVVFDDGSEGVYKPASGEDSGTRGSIPDGGLFGREVAASRLDTMLGFALVPTTTLWDGPHGMGSLQRFVPNLLRFRAPDQYTQFERDRMAVLDYVIGNGDRHRQNWYTDPAGRLVPIDHGTSFPEDKNSFSLMRPGTTSKASLTIRGIRSDFVADALGRPLTTQVVEQVRAADTRGIAKMLGDLGLSDHAVRGAISRLNEVQRHGMITGDAWDGRITNSILGPVRQSKP